MTQQEFDTEMAALNAEKRKISMNLLIESQEANRKKNLAIQMAYQIYEDQTRDIQARRYEAYQKIEVRKLELKRRFAEEQELKEN